MTQESPPGPGGTGRLTFPCTPTRRRSTTPLAFVGTIAAGWVTFAVADLLGLERGTFWTSVLLMSVALLLLVAGAGVFGRRSRLELTPTSVTYRRPFLLASEPRWSLDVRDVTAIHLDQHRYVGTGHDRTGVVFTVRHGPSRGAVTDLGGPIELDRLAALLRSGTGAHVQLTESHRPVTHAPDH